MSKSKAECDGPCPMEEIEPRHFKCKKCGYEFKYHNWSGWPGAFCLDCGIEDPMENALADGWVRFKNTGDEWVTEEYRLQVMEALRSCPIR